MKIESGKCDKCHKPIYSYTGEDKCAAFSGVDEEKDFVTDVSHPKKIKKYHYECYGIPSPAQMAVASFRRP